MEIGWDIITTSTVFRHRLARGALVRQKSETALEAWEGVPQFFGGLTESLFFYYDTACSAVTIFEIRLLDRCRLRMDSGNRSLPPGAKAKIERPVVLIYPALLYQL